MSASDKILLEKVVSLVLELKPLIDIYDSFTLPNRGKDFWVAKINKPILIVPKLRYYLPEGDYFIEKILQDKDGQRGK